MIAVPLTHSMLGKNFSKRHLEVFFCCCCCCFFFLFLQKKAFDILCKLSPEVTISMICSTPIFWGEKKQNIISLSTAELARRVIKGKFTDETSKGYRFLETFMPVY